MSVKSIVGKEPIRARMSIIPWKNGNVDLVKSVKISIPVVAKASKLSKPELHQKF